MTFVKLILIFLASAPAVCAQNPAPSADTLKKANARPIASPTPRVEPFVSESVEQMTGQCVMLETEQGAIVIEMLPNKAPEAVRGFLNLAASGALDTTTFVERAGKTTATTTVLYASREVRDAVLKSPMERGVAESYDKLAELLAATPAGAVK